MTAGGSSPSGATPQRWFGTELGARVASAIVLVIITLFATYQGGWLFALFWLVAGIATVIEWTDMTRVERRRPVQGVLTVGLVALTGLYLHSDGIVIATGAVLVILLAAAVLARSGRDRAWACSGFLYASVIAIVPPIVRDHPEVGLVGILWMFAVVWATDIAAYFTGRRFGGPKLWPRVSPKKTWSGFAGGLLAGIVAGGVVFLIGRSFGWTAPVGLPAVLAVSALSSGASQLGDLGESALKRAFGVKDSSHLIPGHGGVMDRLDGFWAVAALIGLVLLGARLTQTVA